MKRVAGSLAVLFLLVAAAPAAPAAAQRPPADTARGGVLGEVEDIVQRSGIVEALEAIAKATAPEIERAMDQLTSTLNALATRIAEDPELRSSAARAATGMVGVAEILVVEHSNVLLEALREAAERIEAVSAKRATGSGGAAGR